ncbi:MAG TPA: serine/threonine-protein kinase [Drouetiella sp.]
MTSQDKISSNAKFSPGKILDGRYLVLEVLGQGGMGTVYKVEQVFLGSSLALKIISDTALSDVNVRRFQAEARASAALKHPNIVAMHDFGVLENQTPFLAMEFVQGETLEALLKTRVLMLDDTIDMFMQICAGLAHAHERGIVHRDIKPSNIMILDQLPLNTEGSVKILDFGIAKLMQHEGGEIQALTKTGEIFGSPLYMSPEQCSGELVDSRSDIYSLGCVLFEALTGAAPFIGENALATMMLHQSSPTPLLREASLGAEFPNELQQIIQTMLAKEPTQRYQKLTEAMEDLAAIKRGQTPNRSVAISKLNIARPVSSKQLTFGRGAYWGILSANAVTSCLLTAMITHFGFTQNSGTTVPQVSTLVTSSSPQYSPIVQEKNENLLNEIAAGKATFKIRYDFNDAQLSAFKGYKGAQILDIANADVTDTGLKFLSDSNLLNLTVRGCAIKTINSVANFHYLQSINLKDTQVDDRAVPVLLSLKNLYIVDLSKTMISNDGLRKLTESDSIRNLVLPREEYPREFIEELQKKMPVCSINEKKSYLDTLVAKKKISEPSAVLAEKIALMEKLYPSRNCMGEEKARLAEKKLTQEKIHEAKVLSDEAINSIERAQVENWLHLALSIRARVASKENDFAKYDELMTRAAKSAWMTLHHDRPEAPQMFFVCSSSSPDEKYLSHSLAIAEKGYEICEKFPEAGKSFFEPFLSRITWYCFTLKEFERAKEYSQKLLDLTKKMNGEQSIEYANALIFTGRCSQSRAEKVKYFTPGNLIIEQNGYPDKLFALQNLCDASKELVQKFDEEQNTQESIKWARTALAAAKNIKDDSMKRTSDCAKILATRLKRGGLEAEAKSLAKQYQLPYDSLH